jgi:hypothetical protein
MGNGDGRARPAGGRGLTAAASAQRALAAAQKESFIIREAHPISPKPTTFIAPKYFAFWAGLGRGFLGWRLGGFFVD